MLALLLLKALGPSDRWITIHSHGPDSKGQPVLIQQQPDGSAKVIGGAGGSLNHLRLTGVKSKESLADSIKAKAEIRRDARKKQKERDKALGIKTAKAAAHKDVSEKKRAVEREFVSGVAAAMGWSDADVNFDRAGVPAEQAERLEAAHHAAVLARAKAAVDANRANILRDAGARAEAEFGDVPLESTDPEKLSVSDLDPARSNAGLGFATNYSKRAEGAGLQPEELATEAAAAKKPPAVGAKPREMAGNLELLRDGDALADKMLPKIVDAKKALDLLKLDKKRRAVAGQARDAHKRINDSQVAPKAFVVDVDEAKIAADVKKEISADLRTISTRAFLAEVGKSAVDPTATLGRHIGVGAYNSVNALALTAGGAALVDRSVVDVLGIAGAAEVLARRLRSDLRQTEFERVADGMEDFHLNHYMAASQEAIDRATELHDQAKEIELGAIEAGDDLPMLQEINHRKGEAIAEAQRVLGEALGEMEANAALVYAMKSPADDKPFQVSLGNIAVESAIKQARAIGLQRGDYALATADGNRILSIAPEGMSRLAAPVNRADLEQVRRNLDIIRGKYDEDGWLPLGISDRPDLDLEARPGVAPSLAVPFSPGGNLESDVKSYIGGRTADGDPPADIVADLQSAEFFGKVGPERAEEYLKLLDRLAPLADESGKMRSADSLAPDFEAMADDFVKATYGASRTPLHRQSFPVDDASVDALHRALAAEPAGVAAYKPIGEMRPEDQRSIRDWFAKNVAKESPEAAAMRADLERHASAEPAAEVEDMFGDKAPNPEHTDWRGRRDEMAAKVNDAALGWPKFVAAMHGPERAYAAVQDMVRSSISKQFADNYNTLRPDAPLKLGRGSIRNNLDAVDAVDPKARVARAAWETALLDSQRNRTAGKYAAGGVRDKLDAARSEQAGFDAAQMGFFAGDGDLDAQAGAAAKEPGAGERYTLGHEAERQIGKIIPEVGRNFRAGNPVRLFRPSMSGEKNVARQRAVKMIEANKRVVLSFGTGAGKTLIGLGAFTHLQQQGKAKRGLFLVPSIVQGQFGAEALRFLKPNTFNWHAEPGASQAERIAAYKDPKHDFAVMTHQAYRDDMIHIGAGHAGLSNEEMAVRVNEMSAAERKAWMAETAKREGINFDYINVDEGHNLLNRAGKENSSLANVIDAATDNSEYYVNASADPTKNDASEAFSLLQKMDPGRYTDRDAFMRKYGVDTVASKDELRREMARFQFPHKIDPDVKATRTERKVPVSPAQHAEIEKATAAANAGRLARSRGETDVAAMRTLSPSSFDGVPEDQHEAVAAKLQRDVGILANTATRRILDAHPDSPKLDDAVRVARERRGKPGVIFAHSLAAVEQLRQRFEKEGYRVVALTGADSAKVKERKKLEFNPDQGEATADIMIASDAGAVGMNAQRGEWLVNYDTSQTAMTHAQRNGRIHRTGQKNDIDLIDLVSDHPEERKARSRLRTKYALREAMTTPMESLDDTGVAHFIRQREIAVAQGSAYQ